MIRPGHEPSDSRRLTGDNIFTGGVVGAASCIQNNVANAVLHPLRSPGLREIKICTFAAHAVWTTHVHRVSARFKYA